ncbi:uncharacterized protein LOC131313927 [Rhododendron vialii]|uniref:uncharacterized protein LOC131313927 n=1 Tax=Rhododendron vialii TaxID=182163 RepID=UPI00265FF144|nr:uncharacterized protein LOC131313927 [Rhododendron vialii]
MVAEVSDIEIKETFWSLHLGKAPGPDGYNAGFVKGRRIADNIFLTQELMRGYHKSSSSPRCAMKWLQACVTTANYSLSINGEVTGYILGKKGLRQGDPLSSYLFVIVMEILTCLLKEKSLLHDFHFHWRCGATKLVNLCFADDLMIFYKGELTSINHIQDAFSEFQSLSVDNIIAKTKSWTNRDLTYAGRVQLIRNVLFSMQTYWSSLFIIPKKIAVCIAQFISKFGNRIAYDSGIPKDANVSHIIHNSNWAFPITQTLELNEMRSSLPPLVQSSLSGADHVRWTLTSKGQFSIASLWDKLRTSFPWVMWHKLCLVASSKFDLRVLLVLLIHKSSVILLTSNYQYVATSFEAATLLPITYGAAALVIAAAICFIR